MIGFRRSSHAIRATTKFTVLITSIRADLDQNPGGVKQLQLMVHRHKKRLYTKPAPMTLKDSKLEVMWPNDLNVLTLNATLYESKAGKASGYSDKNYMISLLDYSNAKKPKELYRGEVNLPDMVPPSKQLEEIQRLRVDLEHCLGLR